MHHGTAKGPASKRVGSFSSVSIFSPFFFSAASSGFLDDTPFAARWSVSTRTRSNKDAHYPGLGFLFSRG